MKFVKKFKLCALAFVSLIFLIGEAFSVSLRKIETELSADMERHHMAHKAHHKAEVKAHTETAAKTHAQIQGAHFNATNNSLSKSLYKDMNNSYVKQDIPTFKTTNRKWIDNKLYDKQLEDIYHDFLYKQDSEITPKGVKAAIQLFVSQFEACDKSKDNVLSLEEFEGCMANDTYLNQIKPPEIKFATFANYSFTNNTGFYPILYNVMDTFNLNYTNFHDYMLLRLFVFSWRKCSVLGPFIEEVGFECAIEIAGGWKTLSRTTSRHLYKLALELSNGSGNVRNIDFISYVIVAQSARLFGKINGKEDQDATRSEFNLALDSNMLPSRYNQEIISQLFLLLEEIDRPNQGVDILSFVFYDFSLRLFEVKNAQRRWNLSLKEFSNLFNNYLFPSAILGEFHAIPQNNITAQSYQMYTYLNISNYQQEADYFLKFSQLSEKKSRGQLGHQVGNHLVPNPANFTFNLNTTATWLFKILDNDSDGFLSFYDFGNFMQIAYLFSNFDAYNHKKIVAGTLYEKYSTYSDFPYVSYNLRHRANRFNLLPQDLYIDLMRAVLVLRIDDIVKASVRRVDPTTLYEVEIKSIFSNCNLGHVSDGHLNKCLRGVDDNNVPKYDWECAFLQAVTDTAQYLESSYFYLSSKFGNLTLTNTQFVNVDPGIK